MRRMVHIIAIVLLMTGACQCGNTRVEGSFRLYEVSAFKQLANVAGHITLTATCRAGDQMIGGGYVAPDPPALRTLPPAVPPGPDSWVTYPWLVVESSAPDPADAKQPTGWTVQVFIPAGPFPNSSSYDGLLSAYAYCLDHRGPSVTATHVASLPVHVPGELPSVTLPAPVTITVVCPPGSTVTAGGFSIAHDISPTSPAGIENNGLWASIPLLGGGGTAVGWQIQMHWLTAGGSYPGLGAGDPDVTTHAMCALNTLRPGPIAKVGFYTDTPASSNGQLCYLCTQNGAAICAKDEVATGGGVEFGGVVGENSALNIIPRAIWQSSAQDDFANWHIRGIWGHQKGPGNSSEMIAEALCIKVPPHLTVRITNPVAIDGPPTFDELDQSGHTSPINFTAVATDAAGNKLTAPHVELKWTIDNQPIGTGESLNATAPTPTTNCATRTEVVRVEATDDSGQVADDSVLIVVRESCYLP